MAVTFLTQASSGATRCSGTDGDLTTLLDWAVSGRHGWTTLYTGTHKRIYQSVSGHLVYVNHNSADSGAAQFALVRGCESATDVDTRTNEFPTVAQVADTHSNWMCSLSADTTANNYTVLVGDDFFIFAPELHWSSGYNVYIFGATATQYSADDYAVVINVRDSSDTSTAPYGLVGTSSGGTANNGAASSHSLFWKRDITGSVMSSRGGVALPGSYVGNLGYGNAALTGYLSGVLKDAFSLCCCGSTTTTLGTNALYHRGWFPQLWAPFHTGPGTLASGDTFTDAEWNPAASFSVLRGNANLWLIVETTDTWAPPYSSSTSGNSTSSFGFVG